MSDDKTQYDSPWKEMLELYFEDFMAFFFPMIHQQIDWNTDILFLDKELQQVVRDAELGVRIADKLVRVVPKGSDEEIWVYVHIEIQGQHETVFSERMYVYNYRLFDRYHRPICSLAILTDNRPEWRPQQFRYDIWGCEASLTFPVMKLLDYQGREAELEQSMNPFAIVVLANLKTITTQKEPEERFRWKIRLFKLLYEHGYSREDILELTRFLDWIMVLPKGLEQRFDETMTQYEEERQMQYVTSFERHGMEKGLQQGLQQGLKQGLQEGHEAGLQVGLQEGRQEGMIEQARQAIFDILGVRFEAFRNGIVAYVNRQTDLALLSDLLRKAATVGSLAEFEAIVTAEQVTK